MWGGIFSSGKLVPCMAKKVTTTWRQALPCKHLDLPSSLNSIETRIELDEQCSVPRSEKETSRSWDEYMEGSPFLSEMQRSFKFYSFSFCEVRGCEVERNLSHVDVGCDHHLR
jgi:hypothetical protein